jgi:hypothetical protein
MSRRSTRPSTSSSRQMMIAWKVSGLSHRPAIMASRPASMRFAMAISPSRERSSTEPISRRYMRTGSSVRSVGSFAVVSRTTTARAGAASAISPPSASSSSPAASPSAAAVRPSSASSASTTLMPISESWPSTSSICSEENSSEGRTSFNSS